MYQLTEAQQRVTVSLLRERDAIVALANRKAQEINTALEAAAFAFASQAGLEGDWAFAQDQPGGPIGLREKGGDPEGDEVQGEATGI